MNKETRTYLEQRMGRLHLRQRLGIEGPPQRIFGGGLNFLHLENWYAIHRLINGILKLSGLYWRGYANACRHRVTRQDLHLDALPPAFDGYTLLHLSDLHVDMHPAATDALMQHLEGLEYDLCVMTGDYRALTGGDYGRAMEAMAAIRHRIPTPVLAVLGNHDSVRMVPDLEAMGIQMLLNESQVLERGEARLHVAGVDDAHYYRVDNLQKAAEEIPESDASILLCHTPEIYRQAAFAGFDLMLCGHTHGGQICLPGGIAPIMEVHCPRRYCRGAWKYHRMLGYTSVGAGTSVAPVRFNCPPEIALHRLRCAPSRVVRESAVTANRATDPPTASR